MPCVFLSLSVTACVCCVLKGSQVGWVQLQHKHNIVALFCVVWNWSKYDRPPSCDTCAVGLVWPRSWTQKLKWSVLSCSTPQDCKRSCFQHIWDHFVLLHKIFVMFDWEGRIHSQVHSYACLTTCLHKYLISQSHAQRHEGMVKMTFDLFGEQQFWGKPSCWRQQSDENGQTALSW